MSQVKYNIIVAATEEGGIGFENNLPWKISGDMKYFKDVTTGNEKGKLRVVLVLSSILLNIRNFAIYLFIYIFDLNNLRQEKCCDHG